MVAPGKPTSGKATASLVLGICGIVVCPFFILNVPAIVLGMQAKREIKQRGGQIEGQGIANAGIILGWIGIVFSLLILAFFIAGFAGVWDSFDDGSFDDGFDEDDFSTLRAATAIGRALSGLIA